MKTYLPILLACLTLLAAATLEAQSHTSVPLRLAQTIPLPNVEGYLDHMSVDLKRQRLFIPAEHQKSIEVLDLRLGRVIHTIKGFGGYPRKTVYIPYSDQIWVDDGDGTCKAFDGDSYQLVKTVPLSGVDKGSKMIPDNGAYDPATHLFYVAVTEDALAYASAKAVTKGSIGIVDSMTGKYMGAIPVNGTDPAGIAIEPLKPRMFVILGDTGQVAVLDREKRALLATWPITGGPQPHTVTLDAVHHRLFVGSRIQPGHLFQPGKMVVMDSDTGRVIQALDSVGGADEIIYDPASRRIYLAGTTGIVDVFQQVDANHYELLGEVPTGALSKTALLVPELKRFYVAVPKHVILTPPIPQSQEATIEESKILVFDVLP